MDELEKLKADLILKPLNSAQELQDWMYTYLDIKFPMGVVYPGSTHGPIDAMWRIYDLMKTGGSRDVPQVCMLASRDSYKTLSAAAIEVLCMIHFEISVAHGAAIKSQSEKAIQYVNSFFRKVGPYLEENNWKKISIYIRRTIISIRFIIEFCFFLLVFLCFKIIVKYLHFWRL